MLRSYRRLFLLFVLLTIIISSCVPIVPITAPVPSPSATSRPPTAAPTPSATLEPTPAPTATATPVPFYNPAGCRIPSDDYTQVKVNGETLNQRTLTMLEHAYALYGGALKISSTAITQGSYTTAEPESYDTHAGGGAVDLSVRHGGGVLYREIGEVISALRVAGFAAWLRERNELYPGSPVHIHAIAIGDQELSAAAAAQVEAYFGGFSGLPLDGGEPTPDRHGAAPICDWMFEFAGATPAADLAAPADWRETLRQSAAKFITSSEDETVQAARKIGYMNGLYENPANMCGPLTAAILKEAQLLPTDPGPVSDISAYWLASGIRLGDGPWKYYNPEIYELFAFELPPADFDFSSWPLFPGDILYTYAGSGEYEHIFTVTEVDAEGRAYTVTNVQQEDLSWLIARLMLYDPADPAAGAFDVEFMRSARIFGRTGLGGFDVLRRRGVGLAAGSSYPYRVRPGDTLAALAAAFETSIAAILAHNALGDPLNLTVGSMLQIPVNTLGGAASRE